MPYSKGDLVEDFTQGRTYAREILDPDGDVICHVIEDKDAEKLNPGNTAADGLLSHLNRGSVMSKIASLNERPAEEEAVTRQTETFLKSVQAILKSKGFVRVDARLQSAMFHWEFIKGDRVIFITGWHGTGKRGTSRWYGNLKAILSISDNKAYQGTKTAAWKRDKVFDLDVLEGTVADHTKLLIEAANYIVKA